MCGIPYVLYLEVALIASDPFLVFQTIVVKTDYFFNSIWKILCGQKRRVCQYLLDLKFVFLETLWFTLALNLEWHKYQINRKPKHTTNQPKSIGCDIIVN